MQKVEIRSRYRDTEPIVTSRLTVVGGCVHMTKSTYRKYRNRLCYAGDDCLIARSLDYGIDLIINAA